MGILELAEIAVAALGAVHLIRKRGVFDDEFQAKAREEQKTVSYPGCARGLTKCYAFCTTSECPFDKRPTEAWIRKRAAVLRKQARCQHESTRPRYDPMFPELGRRGSVCNNCGMIQKYEGQPWKSGEE